MKIKKFFVENAGIKVLSVLLALIVWTVIININDPYKVKTFSVEVETINEDALESVNKVYEIIEGSTANVKVKGKKSVVDKLAATDIKATADLSDLSSVNAVAIVPRLWKNVSSEVTLECTQVLKVSLEDMKTKQVKVTIVKEGTPEDGYAIGECIAKPNVIEVSGGESVINQIDSIKVFLKVDGITSDLTKRLIPVAYDEDGNKVESATLSYSYNRVRVTAKVLRNKTIPVKVKVKGKPAAGYEFVEAICLPELIEIAGEEKELERISEVTIPIDISGMTSSSAKLEQNVYLNEYLDSDVTVIEEDNMISIRIVIEALAQKNLVLSTSKIHFENLAPGYKVVLLETIPTMNLLIEGRASIIESLEQGSIYPYIDCSGLEPGKYKKAVQMESDQYELINSSKINFRIVQVVDTDTEVTATPKPQETSTPVAATPTPSPTAEAEEEEEPDASEEES